MAATLRFLKYRAVYLWCIFAIAPATTMGHAVAPGEPVFKGHDLGILVGLAVTAIAALAWIPYRTAGRWSPQVLVFLTLVAATWIAQIVLIQMDGSLFALTVFSVPVALTLIAIKPAGIQDIRVSGLVLGYGLAIIALISLPAGALGLMPNGFDGADSALCRTPIICDITGGLDRWAGPFGSVNYAAPIGGLLIVFGLTQRRIHAWLITCTGVIIVILSQGRSALFAVMVGLTVLFLWGSRVSTSPHRRAIRVATIGTLIVAALGFVALFDQTLNGRTVIWQQFIELGRKEPWTGVGDSGIQAFVDSRPGLLTFTHAHSVALDTLVRWGPALTLMALAILTVAAVITARRLSAIGPGPLAIVAFVIAAGLVETIYGWSSWTPYLTILTWAVMTALPPSSAPARPSERRASHTHSLS